MWCLDVGFGLEEIDELFGKEYIATAIKYKGAIVEKEREV
jgi:hypothetical protein